MNNDTIIILIVGILGAIALFFGHVDLATNISMGLIGFLGGITLKKGDK